MRTRLLSTAAASALLLLVPLSASADPSHPPRPSLVSSDAITPFNIAFAKDKVLVADGARNAITKLNRDGRLTPIIEVTGPAGVAVNKRTHSMAYTTTTTSADFVNTASGLHIRSKKGTVFADTHAYEQANNVDGGITYGIVNPTPCQENTFQEVLGGPASYQGAPDSNAYGVTAWRDKWIVADAGANALYRVDRAGRIRLLTVLPAHTATVTREAAETFGLDECVVGARYGFEAVPTDVELGKDGYLYVTTLPGGPEGPELGARGAVWKVNPWSGNAWRIASGFAGATNLAIGKNGKIYVAELFGGQISVVKNRRPQPYVTLPGVVAVETAPNGTLWAATLANEDPAAPGTVVKISKHHHTRS